MSTETTQSSALDTLGTETRVFPPPPEFVRQANVTDPAIYERADRDFEAFWAEHARTLTWRKPFTKVLEWDAPYAKWFADGLLNVSENCLDRHVAAGKGGKVRVVVVRDRQEPAEAVHRAVERMGGGPGGLGIGRELGHEAFPGRGGLAGQRPDAVAADRSGRGPRLSGVAGVLARASRRAISETPRSTIRRWVAIWPRPQSSGDPARRSASVASSTKWSRERRPSSARPVTSRTVSLIHSGRSGGLSTTTSDIGEHSASAQCTMQRKYARMGSYGGSAGWPR